MKWTIGITLMILIAFLGIQVSGVLRPSARTSGNTQIWSTSAHVGYIARLAWSPDGAILASCGNDRMAKLWNASGGLGGTLQGHGSYVWAVAFSHDGKLVATGSHDHTAKLWDLTGSTLFTFKGHDTAVTALAFAPDDRRLVTGSGPPALVLLPVDGEAEFPPARFAGAALIWDLNTRQPLMPLENAINITAFAFSPNGNMLAGVGLKGGVATWDVKSWKQLRSVEGQGGAAKSVCFASDGKTLLSSDTSQVMLRNTQTLDPVLNIAPHERVNCAVMSPDNRFIITGGAYNTVPGPPAGEWKIWNASTGELLSRIDHPSSSVSCMALSPDGKLLAVADYHGMIEVWDMRRLLVRE